MKGCFFGLLTNNGYILVRDLVNEQWVVLFYAGRHFCAISHRFWVEGSIFREHAI